MYVCEVCGGESIDHREGYCPWCGNASLEEASRCHVCGDGWTLAHKSVACRECLENAMTLDNAIELSKFIGYGYTVELPEFFSFYSAKDIEEILKAHILSTPNKEQDNVVKYCNHYDGEFGDFLEMKEQKGEL